MKKMLMMAGLAFLLGSATMANAGQGGCCHTETVRTTTETSHVDILRACNPAVENWLNGAKRTCPSQGSGSGTATTVEKITHCYGKEDRS